MGSPLNSNKYKVIILPSKVIFFYLGDYKKGCGSGDVACQTFEMAMPYVSVARKTAVWPVTDEKLPFRMLLRVFGPMSPINFDEIL